MYCVVCGVPLEDLLNCSVGFFGRIYHSIRRVQTHKLIEASNCLRASANAAEEDYLDYLDGVSLWLNPIEREPMLKTSNAGNTEDFIRDFKGGFNVT